MPRNSRAHVNSQIPELTTMEKLKVCTILGGAAEVALTSVGLAELSGSGLLYGAYTGLAWDTVSRWFLGESGNNVVDSLGDGAIVGGGIGLAAETLGLGDGSAPLAGASVGAVLGTTNYFRRASKASACELPHVTGVEVGADFRKECEREV